MDVDVNESRHHDVITQINNLGRTQRIRCTRAADFHNTRAVDDQRAFRLNTVRKYEIGARQNDHATVI